MPALERAAKPSQKAARLEALIRDYRPLPGTPDELLDGTGQPRAHWRKFLDTLTDFDTNEIERRFSAADRQIRETGVSYRTYGDNRAETRPEAHERQWPLSHLPLVIEESEWEHIARGVEQRAALLESVLADIYGAGRLVTEGDMPAAIAAGSRDYLRPLAGVRPPGGRFLHVYAADIGRGPDGDWWVLGDRTQAPSGAGYALENRLVLSRAMPDLYREMNVERLAPFFQSLRDGLSAAAVRDEPRICLLTPGPLSDTYFEQALLARYLGFLLVEGGDLVARWGQLHIRTVAGLKRADVIWRRIDADFADPLELNGASRLGVPGLVEVIRNGAVCVANALGSGVVESNALLSFLPALAHKLLDRELILPNTATWWCGQRAERERVLANLDDFAIAGAFDSGVPGFSQSGPILASQLNDADKAKLRRTIVERGVDLVGQEIMKISTTPVWDKGRLKPRPFVLRVFATATPTGWKIMPGGFCRVSDRADARAITMSAGARSSDVWVIADKPVAPTSLLPSADKVRIRRIMGNLPSRAADNLFWFGRYLERTEATLRLVRCFASRLAATEISPGNRSRTLRVLTSLIAAWGGVPESEKLPAPSMALAINALQSTEDYGSALALTRSARRTAAALRERLSTDTWHLLARLEACLQGDDASTQTDVLDIANRAIDLMSGISGLMMENMNRIAGWRFLDIGRRIERAVLTCRFARALSGPAAPTDDLDALLDLVDAQITYSSRYMMGFASEPVRDIALLDPFNPRSVAFQIDRLAEHFDALPALNEDGVLEAPNRIVKRLAAEIATTEAAKLETATILAIEQNCMKLSDAVGERYFLQGSTARRGEKAKGLA